METWSPSRGARTPAHLCLSCQGGLAERELGSDTFGVHGMEATPLFPTPQVAGKLRKLPGVCWDLPPRPTDTHRPSGRGRGREQGREHRQPLARQTPRAFPMRWQPQQPSLRWDHCPLDHSVRQGHRRTGRGFGRDGPPAWGCGLLEGLMGTEYMGPHWHPD